MSSISTFLLSTFTSHIRFGGDVNSMALRSQSLSIIYINFCVYAVVLGYEITACYVLNTVKYFPLTIILTPLVSISLYALRKQKYDLAATIVVIHMHFINLCGSLISKVPMAAISGLLLYPTFGFFLGAATKVRILNLVLCISICLHHLLRVKDIFKYTLTDEQSIQVHAFMTVTFLAVVFACSIAFVQKSLELKLWQMVQQSYEKSENLTKEVLQAAEAKDRFVSSLSHEIRNPLNALKGSIDYLLSVVKNANYARVLESAKLSSEILLNLANNVLDAAKLRSEKMDVSYVESNFTDIVKKVFTINSETLKAKKIVGEASIDRVLAERMWIDPSRLLQIMMNLVSNALKFTPEGGRIDIRATWCDDNVSEDKEELLQPTNMEDFVKTSDHLTERSEILELNRSSISSIMGSRRNKSMSYETSTYDEFDTEECESRFKNFEFMKCFETKTFEAKNNFNQISYASEPWMIHYVTSISQQTSSQHKKGYLKVEVSDTGYGIASENIPKLFEMFAQAHQSVNTMHGGTGLGLWICKQLCQKMGGDIKLYSQLNKGTTFVFYIPVDNDRQATVKVNQGQARENVNVMVVDDYPHNRDLHRLLLEREGARVVVACNGREAVEKYKQYEEGHFDFIMMDVLMPEMDGFEAARVIKKWEIQRNRRKKVDICFVSGEYYNEEEVMSAFKHIEGNDEVRGIKCLKKPVDVEMIRRVVDEYKRKSG